MAANSRFDNFRSHLKRDRDLLAIAEERIGPQKQSRQDSSASDDALDDDAACVAELIRKFA